MPIQQTGLAVMLWPRDHGGDDHQARRGRRGRRGAGALPWRGGQWLLRWQQRVNERAHIATLSDHCLRDAGLTPDDMRRDIAWPAWRIWS